MATDLPLWISTDQAERLKASVETLGFSDVTIQRMTSLDYYEKGLDDRLEVKGCHTATGDRTHALAGNAGDLHLVVQHFKQFKGRRDD